MRSALPLLALLLLVAPAAFAAPALLPATAHTNDQCQIVTTPDPRAGVPCLEETLFCLEATAAAVLPGFQPC